MNTGTDEVTFMKRAIIVVFAVMFLSIGIAAWGSGKAHDNITANGIKTAATPTKVTSHKILRNKISVAVYAANWTFTVKDKVYTITSDDFDTRSEAAKLLQAKNPTVQYLPDHPNSHLLYLNNKFYQQRSF